MVFHLRSGYNYTLVLYTKKAHLLPDLVTDLSVSVFEKMSFLEEQFQVRRAYRVSAATLPDTI
jgi:hypothetical protein